MTRLNRIKKQTGLAVMLTGFVAFSLQQSKSSYALESPPPESDSALMERHLHETKVEFAIEEFSDHSFNSQLNDTDLDSILWEDMRMRVGNPEVTYASDSSFKIFTVEITSCGGYCNSEWKSWLHFNDGSGLVISDVHFDDISGIYRLPDGKYLVDSHSYGRSATYSCGTYYLTLLSFSDHAIRYHSFTVDDPYSPTDDYATLGVSQCSYLNTDFWLSYDSSKHEVTYQFADDIIPWESTDSITLRSGRYTYDDGYFALKDSTSSKVKFIGD